MPIDRRQQAISAILHRWLPEGMDPTPDLTGMAEAAVDVLAAAALLPGVPIPDADQATTEVLDHIRDAIHRRQLDVITEEIGALVSRVITAEDERDRVIDAHLRQDYDIEQRVAAALGFPRYPADWPTYHTLSEQILDMIDAVRATQPFEVGALVGPEGATALVAEDADVAVFVDHARRLADALTEQDRITGDHVPTTLVAELCRRHGELRQALLACSQILAATRETL